MTTTIVIDIECDEDGVSCGECAYELSHHESSWCDMHKELCGSRMMPVRTPKCLVAEQRHCELMEALREVRVMREEFLSDPEHDNDTINWALGIFDNHTDNLDALLAREDRTK